MITVGVVRLRPDGTGYRTSCTVKPQKPVEARTTAVHGLTDEMLADQPPFKAYAQHLLQRTGPGATVQPVRQCRPRDIMSRTIAAERNPMNRLRTMARRALRPEGSEAEAERRARRAYEDPSAQ